LVWELELELELENQTITQENTVPQIRFTLTATQVEHEGMNLDDTELAAITKNILQREISAIELNQTLEQLTQYARNNGYPAALAYIPEQTAKEGHLLIKYEPGRFENIHIETNGVLKDNVAHRPFAKLHSGDIIVAGKLEESLRTLRDIPGIGADAILAPGEKPGTSTLSVSLTPRKPQSYVLYAENYGNQSTGRYRYGLQADWKNLGGTGGKLSLGALISNGKQYGGNISYEIPVGHSMTTLGISYSHSDYELGSIWSQLGVEGKSDTFTLYGRTPLVNTFANSTNLVYAFNHRQLKDEYNGLDIGDRHTQSFSIGLDGTRRSRHSAIQYNANFHAGTVTPKSAIADTIATASHTKGAFSKATIDVTALQQLGGPFDVMMKLSGQLAGSKLDSSEHIYLGGARGVRAYPQGEASGDEGLLGTIEFRYRTKLPGLTFSLYYDAGHVNTEKNGSGNQTLQGWGIGLTYMKSEDCFARLDYARRIGLGEGLSNNAESKQRIWFLLGKMF